MSTRRKVAIGLAVLLVFSVGAAILYKNQAGQKPLATAVESVSEPQQPIQKQTLRLIAAGDMLPHDAINKAAQTPAGYDYLQFMKNLQPYFQKADLRFCVQAVPGGGAAYGISGYPVFNAPVEFTRDMAKLGCNVINTGTNHTNDKGQPLINATLDAWKDQPEIVALAGANRSLEEQNTIRYFTKDGIRFAFLSYVTYNNTKNGTPYGVNMFNEETAKRELQAARQQSDIVLVSMRWGTEYSPQIDAKQERLAQFLAANGADIVFGHGQHVQGPVKRLSRPDGGETVVWYGIGNFINAQLEPETLFNGIPIVDIDLKTKKVTNLAFLPFYMHYEWTPEQAARQDLMARTNFMMHTFDQAVAPLARSQNKTTLQDQQVRLQTVLNQFTAVKILDASQY